MNNNNINNNRFQKVINNVNNLNNKNLNININKKNL